MNAFKTSATLAALFASAALGGCYVLPIGPDGQPVYPVAMHTPHGATMAPMPVMPPMPIVLHARLYPMNDAAAQTGVLSGTITAIPGSKGQFQLNYRGDMLAGEATRVSGDDRRGVASAFGSGGLSMSCEYQMAHARQGAGTCQFSNGARYQVHIGG
jgi:hypothetical protein